MPYIRCTITDHTKRFRISDLFRAANGSAISGITIVGFNPNAYTNVQYATVQHDPSSLANNLFVGSSDVDSTHYGLLVLRGNNEPLFPASGNSIRLGNLWIATDTDGAVFQMLTQVM